LRFSSLLIWGAEGAGTGEVSMDVDCNMAQAFENPQGTGQSETVAPRYATAAIAEPPTDAS